VVRVALEQISSSPPRGRGMSRFGVIGCVAVSPAPIVLNDASGLLVWGYGDLHYTVCGI
jgi:hypothetical protein